MKTRIFVNSNGGGLTQQGMTSTPAGKGRASGLHGDIQLWIMPPNGMRILPGLGTSFAILMLGFISIWLPTLNLLIDEEAVTTCFAHQVQTAGVNNKLPSVSCKDHFPRSIPQLAQV